MKKLSVLLLAVFIAFSFASCDNSTPSPVDNAPEINTQDKFGALEDGAKAEISLYHSSLLLDEKAFENIQKLTAEASEKPNTEVSESFYNGSLKITAKQDGENGYIKIDYDEYALDQYTVWGTYELSGPLDVDHNRMKISVVFRADEAISELGLVSGDVFSITYEMDETSGHLTASLNGEPLKITM